MPAQPTVAIREPARLLEHWDVEDSPLWSSGVMPDSAAYWRFIRYVRARVDVAEIERYIAPIVDAATKDVKEGWKAVLKLHNHNFFFGKKLIVPGVPWPSANDAQEMKNLSLDGLVFPRTGVTNGFITSHLKPEELSWFKGADEE